MFARKNITPVEMLLVSRQVSNTNIDCSLLRDMSYFENVKYIKMLYLFKIIIDEEHFIKYIFNQSIYVLCVQKRHIHMYSTYCIQSHATQQDKLSLKTANDAFNNISKHCCIL